MQTAKLKKHESRSNLVVTNSESAMLQRWLMAGHSKFVFAMRSNQIVVGRYLALGQYTWSIEASTRDGVVPMLIYKHDIARIHPTKEAPAKTPVEMDCQLDMDAESKMLAQWIQSEQTYLVFVNRANQVLRGTLIELGQYTWAVTVKGKDGTHEMMINKLDLSRVHPVRKVAK